MAGNMQICKSNQKVTYIHDVEAAWHEHSYIHLQQSRSLIQLTRLRHDTSKASVGS